jgi:ATP-dependent DNA helicase PIF1
LRGVWAQVLDLCLQGKNVFFTGMGGTGKSLVLKLLLQRLRALHGDSAVAATAPTGVAAINVGGQTLHSFVGCGVPTCVASFGELMWRRRQTWEGLKVLVVDEVSMLDAAFLDWLDVIVRGFRGKRHSEKAFGGIQLIFTGDFHQLPAVKGKSLPSSHQRPGQDLSHGRPGQATGGDKVLPVALRDLTACIFQSACFKEANFHVVELTKVFRQEDVEFVSMLARVRKGDVDDKVLRFFGKLARKLPEDAIKPTQLMCLVKDVHKENCEQLRALPGMTHWYRANDSFDYNVEATGYDRSQRKLETCELMKEDSHVAKVVELKVGAQVMLTKNMLQVMPSPHSRLAAHLYVHLYTRTCTYIQIYRYIHIYTYIHTYTHR